MIKIERQFNLGYASPVHRGIYFWLDNEKRQNVSLDQLVYEALGDDSDYPSGVNLQGITINIEIEKTTKSEWPMRQSG